VVCDPFESLLDRIFARSQPGDVIVTEGEPDGWERTIVRTETGFRIDEAEHYPVFAEERAWSESFDEPAARAWLRRADLGPHSSRRRALEDAFPQVVDD
jgi:hypothetical protein